MLYRENGQFKTSYRADQQILPIAQDRIAIGIILAIAFIAVPMLASDYIFRAILIPFVIMALAALGVNILVGYCGQHGHAAVGRFQGNFGDLELFFQREGAGLAERAAGHQPVDAVADLEVDVPGRAFGVDGLVGVELGGDGGKDALPAGLWVHGVLLGCVGR